jgi:hypothetical protein
VLFYGEAHFTVIFHTFLYTLSATQKLVSYTASGLSNLYVFIEVIIIIFPAIFGYLHSWCNLYKDLGVLFVHFPKLVINILKYLEMLLSSYVNIY